MDKIDVYTLCYNEERFIPYFLRHYGSFVRNIYVYDNFSTDRSVDILRENPKVTVNTNGWSRGKTDEQFHTNLKNSCYKGSDADWVIVVDMDELVYHFSLEWLLREYKRAGVTLPHTFGYQMVSKRFPTTKDQIYDEIRMGVPDDLYSKPAIFNPSINIQYSAGAHYCDPLGPVKYSAQGEIKLLHYKSLGWEYLLERNTMGKGRVLASPESIAHGWGSHYLVGEQRMRAEFDARLRGAERVV